MTEPLECDRLHCNDTIGRCATCPLGCVHAPGIPTPNRPWAARACRKCGRLINLQPS